MGYQMGNGQYSGTDDVSLMSGTALAVTTNGTPVDVRHGVLALTLATTVGTGTLDVAIQTRKDASDPWHTVAAFAQQAGVASERKVFAGVDRQVRAVATIAGGSFTFTVSGDAR